MVIPKVSMLIGSLAASYKPRSDSCGHTEKLSLQVSHHLAKRPNKSQSVGVNLGAHTDDCHVFPPTSLCKCSPVAPVV